MLIITNPRIGIYISLLSCDHVMCTFFTVTWMQGIKPTRLLQSNWFLFPTLITNITLVLPGHTSGQEPLLLCVTVTNIKGIFAATSGGPRLKQMWDEVKFTPNLTSIWAEYFICEYIWDPCMSEDRIQSFNSLPEVKDLKVPLASWLLFILMKLS